MTKIDDEFYILFLADGLLVYITEDYYTLVSIAPVEHKKIMQFLYTEF
jgi:hypothetical protein